MNCFMSIAFKEADVALKTSRYLIMIDESKIQQTHSERPIDIIIESLAQIDIINNSEQITSNIASLAVGKSDIGGIAAPGAITILGVNQYFTPGAEHNIDIYIDAEDRGWLAKTTISLDGQVIAEPPFDMLKQAPERQVHKYKPTFFTRYTNSDDGTPCQTEFETGSIICGMFEALFDAGLPAARSILTKDHAISACVNAHLNGRSIPTNKRFCPIREIIQCAAYQYRSFLEDGYLISERGWNPQCFLPGPRFEEIRNKSHKQLFDFGKHIQAKMAEKSDHFTQKSLLSIFEGTKVDVVQFAGSLTKHPHFKDSEHSKISHSAHAQYLSEICRSYFEAI